MTQRKHRNLGDVCRPCPGKELESHLFFLLFEQEECSVVVTLRERVVVSIWYFSDLSF